MTILDDSYHVEMPDMTIWSVPVRVIAENRAVYYAPRDFEDDEIASLKDTEEWFENYPEEIHEWAAGNMNWEDVESVATLVETPTPDEDEDYQEGWVNGEHQIVMASPEEDDG